MRNLTLFFFLFTISTLRGQVVISEICPANADIIYDPTYYNFSGWIELSNTNSSTVNIGGFYLSDKQSELTKWRIPAGTSIAANGFLLIWCDGLNTGSHTNFSLDNDGEDVVLANASGLMLDKITFPQQFTNISYGRIANGDGSWGYLAVPTPGAINSTSSATQQLTKPIFSVAGGRYSAPQQIALTHTQANAKIRYTTDGKEPTSSSTLFTTAIPVGQTKTIKAKVFLDGFLPGETETQTYFINEHTFSIPVVSISTNPDYLYDNTIGIYVDGTNGIPGNCQGNPVNWNQDWDRHAVFEYFDKNGNRLIDQSVDIRIGGGCSRNQPQKSLVVKAREKYGSKIIDYRFFESKSIDKFGGFVLRNSGNDFNVTMFRDAMMQALTVGQMDIDYLDYQPAILYLNGLYMGIQNMREKIDADYIESNYGVDKNDLDLIETYENPLEGTSDVYVNYRTELEGMDRSTPEAFEFINQNIDVQEYINYLVTEIYYGNTDWPGNNIKFWRQRSTNGKFRWILWDLDFGFALYEGASWATHPTLNFATATDGPGWPNPAWSTLHIRLVLENPVFRSRFIQTMNTAINTTFQPDRVISAINDFQSRIAAEMPYHKARWWGNINDWNFEVQRLRDFAGVRNTYMRQHMAEFFGLNETIRFSVRVKEGEGKFKLNGVISDQPIQEQPYFKNLPFELSPVPALGYKFKEWKIIKRESFQVPLISLGASWKYFDQGISPGINWISDSFDDGAWLTGPAQLGYGEGDEQTVVSYGPDPNNKFITTYFRNSITVADTVGLGQLNGTILVDDGAVVYLNGLEVLRTNMPAGTVSSNTLALGGAVENYYIPFTIPKGLLKPGNNILAVEVHQVSASSTDVSFDFSLQTIQIGNEVEEITNIALQQDTAYTDLIVEAFFDIDNSVVSGIVINEINAAISTVVDNAGEAEDWIELYNSGSQTVNLAGLYITDNFGFKTKHQILSGIGDEMLLAPGAYKILWADEDLDQGADHLSFKLSADGEEAGLYQVTENNVNVLDEVTFGAQPSEGSFSRIPDATGPFVFTSLSTPGSINQFVTSIEDDLQVSVYPNPVSSNIFIESSAPIQKIELLDCFWRLLKSFTGKVDPAISMSDNPPGIYILRFQSAGQLKIIKVIKE